MSRISKQLLLPIVYVIIAANTGRSAEIPTAVGHVFEEYCFDCHDEEMKKGELDLTSLKYDPSNQQNLNRWILIHDRVSDGEMPPKKKSQPTLEESRISRR